LFFFFFQAEDGIRDKLVTGVQTCALPICLGFCRSCPPAGCLSRLPMKPRRSSIRLSAAVTGVRCSIKLRRIRSATVGKKVSAGRSEERRVGKECRSGGGPECEEERGWKRA